MTPFKVIVDGVDLTPYVLSVTNQFELDELAVISSVNLKADTSEGNMAVLSMLMNMGNRFAPVKILTRGYYSGAFATRMKGYLWNVSGNNPHTDSSFTVKQTPPNADTSENSIYNGEEPYIQKRIDEIVKDLIDKSGLRRGKIDEFPQLMGVWYPANRTLFENLQILADSVGAIVQINPPSIKGVSGGAIDVKGFFELNEDQNKATIAQKNVLRFILRNSPALGNKGVFGDEINSIDEAGLNDEISGGKLLLSSNVFDVQKMPYDLVYGSGQENSNGRVVDPNKLFYTKDDQYKSDTQKKFEELMRQGVDEEILRIIRKAGILALVDPNTGKTSYATRIRDDSGKVLTVPVAVAAASLRGEMVVNFIDSDEDKGLLGKTGLTLTLEPGDLLYPIIRVKAISGFEYNPPQGDGKLPTTPDNTSLWGATRKNYIVTPLKIKPTDTAGDLAEQLSQNADTAKLVRQVEFTDAFGNKKKQYVFYDSSILSRDPVTGELSPLDKDDLDEVTSQLTPEQKKALEEKGITPEQFSKILPQEIYKLAQKKRAALWGTMQTPSDDFLRIYYPDLYQLDQDNNLDPEVMDQIIKYENANNPYMYNNTQANYEEVKATTKNLPIFSEGESIGEYLKTMGEITPDKDGNISVGIAGTLTGGTAGTDGGGKRLDGKTRLYRAQSLVFNPSTGANLTGSELVQKGEWPFSMTVEIDSAVEISPGYIINCDSTFGILSGPYTIGTVTETIGPGQMSMQLQLRTQSYMSGFGRAANSLNQASREGSAADPNAILPGDAKLQGTQPVGNGNNGGSDIGRKIAAAARVGLTYAFPGDPNATANGYCSAWARAVTQMTFGKTNRDLFSGGSAIDTGRLMRSKLPVYTLAQAGGLSGLRPGDYILQEQGSNGNGHIGIMGDDGYIYENGYNGRRRILPQQFGTITGVVRAEDVAKYYSDKK